MKPSGWSGPDVPALAGGQVHPLQPQVLRRGVQRAVVGGVDLVVEAVASAPLHPVLVEHALGPVGGAGPAPAAVVLEPAADVEGLGVVQADAVELAHRQVGDVEPGDAPIPRDPQSPVIGFHDVLRVGGIHPHQAVVAMERLPRLREGAPPVVGPRVAVHHVDALIVVGVHQDLRRVHGPGIPVGHESPALALVFGAVDPGLTLLVGGGGVEALPLLHAHVDDARVRAVHGDADAADVACGEPVVQPGVGEPGPGVAAVGALPQRAARSAPVEAVGAAAALVRGRVEDRGIPGIHGHVDHAGVLVYVQHPLPGRAPVA